MELKETQDTLECIYCGELVRIRNSETESKKTDDSSKIQEEYSKLFNRNNSAVPDSIKKWNWGAFLLNCIWGVCNGIYWPLISLFIPGSGIIISLILGINGNEWAWKAKEWKSESEFLECQRKWTIAGWVAALVMFVSIVIIIVSIFSW